MLRWVSDLYYGRPERYLNDEALVSYNKFKYIKTQIVRELYDLPKKYHLSPLQQTALESTWYKLIDVVDDVMNFIVEHNCAFEVNYEIQSQTHNLTEEALQTKFEIQSRMHKLAQDAVNITQIWNMFKPVIDEIMSKAEVVSKSEKRLPEPPLPPGDTKAIMRNPLVGGGHVTHDDTSIILRNEAGKPIHELVLWQNVHSSPSYYFDGNGRIVEDLSGSIFGDFQLMNRLDSECENATSYRAINMRMNNNNECVLKITNGNPEYFDSVFRDVLDDPESFNARRAELNAHRTISGIDVASLHSVVREYDVIKYVTTHSENLKDAPVVSVGVQGVLLCLGELRYAWTSEFMEGSLFSWLQTSRGNVELAQYVALIFDMFRKIDMLHKYGILHLDARASNWQYKTTVDFPTINVKLSDLGGAFKRPSWMYVERPFKEKAEKLMKVSLQAMEFVQFAIGVNHIIHTMLFAVLTKEESARIGQLGSLITAYINSVLGGMPNLIFDGGKPKTFERLLVDSKLTEYVLELAHMLHVREQARLQKFNSTILSLHIRPAQQEIE